MNGVTLISWVSAKSSSSSRSLPIEIAIAYSAARERALLGELTWVRSRSRDNSRAAAPDDTADQFQVALRHPREVIVDDDRRDRRDQTDRGGEQRFGDAGRDHGEIGRLRFRDADEAVHDAPDGAEQADERRCRADGGQQSHPDPDPAAFGAHDFGKARGRAFLDAVVAGNSGRQPRLAHRGGQQRRQHAVLGAERELRFRQRPRIADLAQRRRAACACTTDSSIIFAMKTVQVTSEAKARPIMTALTMMSADRNIDHGDNSCSAATVDFSALALLPSAGCAAASEAAGAAAARLARQSARAEQPRTARERLPAVRARRTGCDGGRRRRHHGGLRRRAERPSAAAPARAQPATASPAQGSAAQIVRNSVVFILRPSSGSDCDRCRSI